MKTILLVMLALIITQANAKEATTSSFNEVLDVIATDPQPKSELEKNEIIAYQGAKHPRYPVNASTLFGGLGDQLERDAIRTINKDEDYYDRMPKLLHSNGVCVSGQWTPLQNSKYTGLFKNGNKGLFIGRISTTMEAVLAKDKRGFGLAGKIFPTQNPDETVKTANFFSVDVLLGTNAKRMLDVKLTNEPDTGFDVSLIGLMIKVASALTKGDENPGFRPLYPVAESGLSTDDMVRTPTWLRISPAIDTIKNNSKDFRDEILLAVEQNKVLKFNVDVSDNNHDREKDSDWRPIGEIAIDQAIVSYGCDRRLHFAHPKLQK